MIRETAIAANRCAARQDAADRRHKIVPDYGLAGGPEGLESRLGILTTIRAICAFLGRPYIQKGRGMKKLGVAAIALAALIFTSSVVSAQVCVVAIIAKALYANATENRELTQKEAMTCGILVDEKERKAMLAKNKKEARAAKKH